MTTKTKICISFLLFCVSFAPNMIFAQDIGTINKEIDAKKQDINDIKKRLETYQQNIKTKQKEAATLKNQLSLLENRIAKAELDIKETSAEIGQTELEVKKKELEILAKEADIAKKKSYLSSIIQNIHESDQQTGFKIFLLNESISDYFTEVEYTKDLEANVHETLLGLKDDKTELLGDKTELETKKSQLTTLNKDIELQKDELTGQVSYKNDLLDQTKSSEQKFTDLYYKAKQEQQAISNELTSLERTARQKLAEMEKTKKRQLGSSELDWPVPNRGVTTYFHDPDYPFRYLFEHPAIDVKAKQGSSIVAPADGYVLKAVNNGMGYSYISLIHSNGISTVFGHVSKIYVSDDDFVAKGDVIGLSGGMPGTPGAGKLTTGPHLHFEVRYNGIPVNPMDYLP